jgi:hypothetical protein
VEASQRSIVDQDDVDGRALPPGVSEGGPHRGTDGLVAQEARPGLP